MLRLEGVSVSIGPVGILRNVDLVADTGQFAGLIGRNGAGKTTLLRTVMGLLRHHEGSLQIDGVPNLARLPVHGRVEAGIGYMPEDRRLIPGLSTEENILVPAWSMRAPDWAGRLAGIYRAIPEVQAFRDRKALQLSGGQQKLVALARAMMAGRRLLLLDEPFEGVAPVLARRLAEVIASLRKTGVTVVLAESSLTHAHGLLDRVFDIDRGSVTARDSLSPLAGRGSG
jgi:branched-chain amino acid transport system ATP-binding protein